MLYVSVSIGVFVTEIMVNFPCSFNNSFSDEKERKACLDSSIKVTRPMTVRLFPNFLLLLLSSFFYFYLFFLCKNGYEVSEIKSNVQDTGSLRKQNEAKKKVSPRKLSQSPLRQEVRKKI